MDIFDLLEQIYCTKDMYLQDGYCFSSLVFLLYPKERLKDVLDLRFTLLSPYPIFALQTIYLCIDKRT